MPTAVASIKKPVVLYRVLRLIFFIVMVAGLVAAGILWYWKTHKKTIIKEKFEESVVKNSKGLYKAKINNLDLDESAGWLSINGFHLTYDSLRFRQLSGNKDLPPMLFSLQVEQIHISGVDDVKQLRKNKLRGKRMEIKNPVIELWYTYTGKHPNRNIPTKEEVYEAIIDGVDLVLDTIQITDAQVKTRNISTGAVLVDIRDLSVLLRDTWINEAGNADTSRLFFSKHFDMDAGLITWSSTNKMYDYIISGPSLRSDEGEIQTSEFLIRPLKGEADFVNALPYQDDRFDVTVKDIRISGVNSSKLLDEMLIGDELYIRAANFRIYRDLNRPRDKKNRVGKYPQQVLNQTSFRFTINRVRMENAFIEYKERNHITGKSGKVQFYNVSGVINNFTNDSASVGRNNIMIADLHSKFLNQVALQTNWTFYLQNPAGRFDVRGSMAGIDARRLNPLSEPMGPASFNSGVLQDLQFDFKGDDRKINGTVRVLYRDLKVTILEKDKGAKGTDKKTFTSFLANLMIKNDNPRKNEAARIAMVNHPRDINRSLFNLCWKSLFSGIRQSVGLPPL